MSLTEVFFFNIRKSLPDSLHGKKRFVYGYPDIRLFVTSLVDNLHTMDSKRKVFNKTDPPTPKRKKKEKKRNEKGSLTCQAYILFVHPVDDNHDISSFFWLVSLKMTCQSYSSPNCLWHMWHTTSEFAGHAVPFSILSKQFTLFSWALSSLLLVYSALMDCTTQGNAFNS